MKLLDTLGAAVVAALVAAPVGAQSSASLKVGISGGGTFPIGSFADANESGFNFGAHLVLSSPFFPQDLKLQVQHNRMNEKGSAARTLITSATLGLEINPGPAVAAVAPFIGLGLGGYRVQTTFTRPVVFSCAACALTGTVGPDYRAVTKFGWYAGGGLRIPLSGFSTFIEADYDRVSLNTTTSRSRRVRYVPVYFGITL